MMQQTSLKAIALQVLKEKQLMQQKCNTKFHNIDNSANKKEDFATNNLINFQFPEKVSNTQSMEPAEVSNTEVECFERFKNQSVREASLNARKILFPEVHIPDKDLRIVYELYRTAVIEGSALYQCKDEEQAQQWVKHFNRNLPTDRSACVIRENELNILTIS